MRIVLTNKCLSELTDRSTWKNDSNPVSTRSKIIVRKPEFSTLDDKSSDLDNNVLRSSFVTVKQRKLNVPKNILHQYNAFPDSSVILDSSGNMPVHTENRALPLSEIVHQSVISKMIMNAKEAEMLDQRNKIIKPEDFRVFGLSRPEKWKVEKMLRKEVNLENHSLVEYLKSKKELSTTFLSKINKTANYKQERKLNKMCQITLVKNKESNKVRERMEMMLLQKKENVQKNTQSLFKKYEQDLSQGSMILTKYAGVKGKESIYKDLHNETSKKYWGNLNVIRSKASKEN